MTKPLRVCVVSDGLPPYCGGAPLRAYRHTQRLREAEDVETLLVAWNRYGNGFAPDPQHENVHPVRLSLQEMSGGKTPIGAAKLLLRLTELNVRLGILLFRLRDEFDLLHVINVASLFSLMTVPLAKLLQKPVILETVGLGGDDPLTLNKRSEHPAQQLFPHRPLKYTLFLQADAYVSKSPALSKTYRTAGLPDVKVFQIPNGVAVEKFKPRTLKQKQALKYKLELDENRVVILFVGAINRLKGVHNLLAAFRNISQRHPKTQLLLVGPTLPQDGAYVQSLRKSIDEWALSERVMLIDEMVGNVHEYMGASDIFCLPTEREGFPGVVIEAMASGLPVIVSRLQGITTEIIRPNHEGVLVPVGDTEKLAGAITELVSDPTLRASLGLAARQRVLREFTDEIVDRQYLQLYRKVLDERPGEGNIRVANGADIA